MSPTDTVDFVKADLEERKCVGVKTYGVAHNSDLKRDHLWDCYEELLDACVYVRAEIHKRSEANLAMAKLLATVVAQRDAAVDELARMEREARGE